MTLDIPQQVRQIAADVFDAPLEAVTPSSSPESIESWDSVTHLNFILAVEEGLGVQFEPEDIAGAADVGAVIRLVEAKRGAKA